MTSKKSQVDASTLSQIWIEAVRLFKHDWKNNFVSVCKQDSYPPIPHSVASCGDLDIFKKNNGFSWQLSMLSLSWKCEMNFTDTHNMASMTKHWWPLLKCSKLYQWYQHLVLPAQFGTLASRFLAIFSIRHGLEPFFLPLKHVLNRPVGQVGRSFLGSLVKSLGNTAHHTRITTQTTQHSYWFEQSLLVHISSEKSITFIYLFSSRVILPGLTKHTLTHLYFSTSVYWISEASGKPGKPSKITLAAYTWALHTTWNARMHF